MTNPIPPAFDNQRQETNHVVWVLCLAIALMVFSAGAFLYMQYRIKVLAAEGAKQLFIAEAKRQQAEIAAAAARHLADKKAGKARPQEEAQLAAPAPRLAEPVEAPPQAAGEQPQDPPGKRN